MTIARALRELKKFDEAEKMLLEIIGTNEKPGWGFSRLYFRKELAMVYEDRGASIADVKAAGAEWGKAKQIWEGLFGIYKNRLGKIPPMTTPEEIKQMRNAFADAYFDLQRCLVKANQQLLKNQPPDKLQTALDSVAKRFVDMEKQIPAAEWQPEVQHRYAELLKETPQMLPAYKTNNGKAFLEKVPA